MDQKRSKIKTNFSKLIFPDTFIGLILSHLLLDLQ